MSSNLVAVKYEGGCVVYTFKVPHGVKITKGEYVVVQNKDGTQKIVEAVTDSFEMNAGDVKTITGIKVISNVVGKVEMKLFGEEKPAETPNEEPSRPSGRNAMSRDEVTRQIDDLIEHCRLMGKEKDASEVWQKDIEALTIAKKAIEDKE